MSLATHPVSSPLKIRLVWFLLSSTVLLTSLLLEFPRACSTECTADPLRFVSGVITSILSRAGAAMLELVASLLSYVLT